MIDTQDAIAAFLAKGGAIKRVAPDATNGMTNRQWYKAARDSDNARVIEEMDADAEQREELAREAFGAARLNGASQNEAMNDYNRVRRYR